MKITIVAALSESMVIGVNNWLPWHIKEDMQRFKHLTTGGVVVMGSNTFKSMGGCLPNRLNIVITRKASKNVTMNVNNCYECCSIPHIIKWCKKRGVKELFVIGGGKVYKSMLKYVDRMYLTVVKSGIKGDTFFPEYDPGLFIETSRESFDKTPISLGYSFVTLDRLVK